MAARFVYSPLDNSREIYQLTQEQLVAIEEAEAEYERGEFVKDEELQKEIDKWLKD